MYTADFYNTLPGDKIVSLLIYSNPDTPLKINIPDFCIDIAFKLRWQGEDETDVHVIKADIPR
jgi:lipid A disaccharide synthetase